MPHCAAYYHHPSVYSLGVCSSYLAIDPPRISRKWNRYKTSQAIDHEYPQGSRIQTLPTPNHREWQNQTRPPRGHGTINQKPRNATECREYSRKPKPRVVAQRPHGRILQPTHHQGRIIDIRRRTTISRSRFLTSLQPILQILRRKKYRATPCPASRASSSKSKNPAGRKSQTQSTQKADTSTCNSGTLVGPTYPK